MCIRDSLGAVTATGVPWLSEDGLYRYFLHYTRARVVVAPWSMKPVLDRLLQEGVPHIQSVLLTHVPEGELPEPPYSNWDHAMERAGLELVSGGRAAVVPSDLCKDDAALWYFTGGTTGVPKGCVHLQSDLPYAAETYGKLVMKLTEDDVTATTSPMAGPYAMGSNLLFPWSVGAAAILDNSMVSHCDARDVFELVSSQRPTVLSTTPAVMKDMVELSQGHLSDHVLPDQLRSLRYITSAGDMLPKSVARQWTQEFDIPILDGLGTSELQHIFVSNTLEEGGSRPGSVGKVVPGYECRVVDKAGQSVEPNEVGEIHVKADSNAVCYWNKHEKSKAELQGDNFKTGDLGYMDDDGFLFLVGREADLTSMFSGKKRGLKLSFHLVEDELLQHPAIRDCAVVNVTCPTTNSTRYTAYCVLQQEVEPDQLLDFLRERVGESSPDHVSILPKIPRNARDKVDRKLLQDMLGAAFVRADLDGDGAIDTAEFESLLKEILPACLLTHGRAELLFKEYDMDGNGAIDFHEFSNAVLDLGARFG
eukprot:TRINITY_DN20044_c0_g2_i1.p1 TRINITY_DN20044_c0_g2~~TRINITY_DN20044_c0_g2_i1.p1  ORF type:complete len:535 (+),score=144.04 TRINITY_DN20044_c0_g2_i1:167-1771(+)